MIPRASTLPHPVAMRLAETEYTRCAELFRSLRPADWTARTVGGELQPKLQPFCPAARPFSDP
jgi:hypothetical protein